MSTEIARMHALVGADTRGFEEGMGRVENRAKAAAGEIGASTKRFAKFGAIATAAGAGMAYGLAKVLPLVKKTKDAAMDMNESISKTKVVFGDAAKDIPGFAGSAVKGFGMSRTAAMENSAAIGSMLIPMGKSQAEAAKMSKQMLRLAADMGSLHNQDPTEMLQRIQSGLAGDMEPLKRFGIVLSETRVKAEAVRMGLVKNVKDSGRVREATIRMDLAQQNYNKAVAEHGRKSVEARRALLSRMTAHRGLKKALQGEATQLTDAQKLQARVNLLLKDSKKARGDWARTSDQAAGKEKKLAASIDDLNAQLGQALLPTYTAVIGALTTLTQWMTENETATKVAGAALAVFTGMAIASTVAVNAFGAAMGIATAATWLWNHALKGNAVVIAITAIIALVSALAIAYEKSERFRNVVNSLRDTLGLVAVAVGQFAAAVIGALGAALSWVKSNWARIATIISGPFAPLVALATNAFGVRSALIGAFNATVAAVSGAMGRVVGAVSSAAGSVKSAAIAVGKGIASGVSNGVKALARLGSDMVVKVAQAIATTASFALGAAVGIGSALVQGMVSGVKSMAGALGDAAAGVVRSAVDRAKSALRIKSPSRVTRDEIGIPIVEGIVAGVSKGERLELALTQTVRDAINAARSTASGLVGTIIGGAGDIMDSMSPAAQRIRAIDAEQQARSDAKRLADIHQRIAEGDVAAQDDLRDYNLEQERRALEKDLAFQKDNLRRRMEAITTAVQTGVLTSKDANAEIIQALKDSGVYYQGAGEELGTYFANGFMDAITGLQRQLGLIYNGPGLGLKFGADVTDPFAVQMQEWRDRRADISGRLRDARTELSDARSNGAGATTITALSKKVGFLEGQLSSWNSRMPVRMSTGGVVPGVGRGDHVAALLEPGELVIPRDMVGRGGRGGGTMVVNVNIAPGTGISRQQARALARDIRSELANEPTLSARQG